MTTEQKSQIVSLRKEGYGYAAVAKKLGLTKNAVSYFCRQNGLAGAQEKKDLLLPARRANVDDTKGTGAACKVKYVFSEESNEAVLPEVLRILSTINQRQE